MDIRDIAKEAEEAAPEIELVQAVEQHATVLDIRSPEEEEDSPLRDRWSRSNTSAFLQIRYSIW